MAPPNPGDVVTSRFSVREEEDGYAISYAVERGTAGLSETRALIHRIRLRDRRRDRSTPIPVGWSFLPVQALPSAEAMYGRGAREERALRDWKLLGNAVASGFTPRPPLEIPALPRDFDTIIIFAGPGVSVEVDARILATMPGGERSVDFAERRLPGYTPLVEVYRLQSVSRVPEPGSAPDQSLLTASYVVSTRADTERMTVPYLYLSDYLFAFGETTRGKTVAELVREIGREPFSPVMEFLDDARTVESFRTEDPAMYGHLYQASVLQATNQLFQGDEVKVTPMPWGTRLTHFTSMISIDIRVPTVAGDPMFAIERREATLGHPVTNTGDEVNHKARFAFHIDAQALLELAFEWVPTFVVEGGGELTQEEIEEIESTQGAPVVFQAVAWRLRRAATGDTAPPITIVKTPGVRVSVQAPMLAELVARTAEHAGERGAPVSNELRHVREVPLVACFEVDRIEDVPEQGEDFAIPSGARDKVLQGQRDEAELLSDELTADLVDGGLRAVAGLAGDIIDVAELAYGLYAGRDFHGRKLTPEHLFLLGLSALPLVNRGILRAGIEVPRSLARTLRAADVGVTAGMTGLFARNVYDYWDAYDEGAPATTAEFF